MIARRKMLAVGGAALILGIVLVLYLSRGQVVSLPEGGSIRIYRMTFTGSLLLEHPGKIGRLLVKQIPLLASFAPFAPAKAFFSSPGGLAVCFLQKPSKIALLNGSPPPLDSPYRLDIEDAFQSVRDSRGLRVLPIPGIDWPDKTNVRFESSGLAATIPIHKDYGPYVKLHIRRKSDPTNGPVLATFQVRNEVFDKE